MNEEEMLNALSKGDCRNPMTDEELKAKFLDLAHGVIGEAKAKTAIESIMNLENLDSVETLISNLKKAAC